LVNERRSASDSAESFFCRFMALPISSRSASGLRARRRVAAAVGEVGLSVAVISPIGGEAPPSPEGVAEGLRRPLSPSDGGLAAVA
jgi:hypothetical protein